MPPTLLSRLLAYTAIDVRKQYMDMCCVLPNELLLLKQSVYYKNSGLSGTQTSLGAMCFFTPAARAA